MADCGLDSCVVVRKMVWDGHMDTQKQDVRRGGMMGEGGRSRGFYLCEKSMKLWSWSVNSEKSTF